MRRTAALVIAASVPTILAAQLPAAPRPAVHLEGLRVGPPERGCVVDPRSGPRTAAVWEAARRVLLATSAAERQGGLFTVRRFFRHLDGATGMVRSVREDSTTERRVTPFRSLSPAELARGGYVRREGADNVFAAPDAGVLLSDEFLDGHCFRVVPGSGAEAGMIGLAFEPVRGRRLPDVSGTLWLDPASTELRSMEFAYTQFPVEPVGEPWGGRMEFLRTEAGAWIVSRWTLRFPVLERSPGGFGNGRARVAAIQEVGGEVVRSRVTVRPAAVVAGVVFDSTRAAPLAGATVTLAGGTSYTARTDSAGAFRIAGVPPGRYEASFAHPRADSLRWAPAGVPVEVAAAGESAVRLGLPARALPRRLEADTVRLAGVVGTAAARSRGLEGWGFYDRADRGVGTQWTGDQFRERGRGRITDHISGTRRVFAVPRGHTGIVFVQRNRGRECWFPVWLDGMRVPASRLNDLRREDVVGVEIYEEGEVPGEFTTTAHYPAAGGRACGAIVVWTTQSR